ncbi:MAG: PIG-L family deacetylase [Chthoniobacterales bacterium]|nr:PIG-L family deacetylase [Chthoniobacterales bacterium]
MKIKNFFAPTGISFAQAAPQVTHLGIGAHQDDLEIMALHGILECYQHSSKNFAGITCTSGAGSPRIGPYADYHDQQMQELRHEEQCQAAKLGEYLFVAQLGFSSAAVQEATKHDLADALHKLLTELHPQIIYTHHPLDKHPTHRAICRAVIEALRRLPQAQHPQQLLGGEVWRSLDWVIDEDKIALDVSTHLELSEKLLTVFQSQIAGGKSYDLAAQGRRYANATFATSHLVDQATQVTYTIDLMPLLKKPQLTLGEFALGFVDRFRKEVEREQS